MLRLVIVATSAFLAGLVVAGPMEYREPTAGEVEQQQRGLSQEAVRAESYYKSPDFAELIGKERKKLEKIQPMPENKLELPDDLRNQRWADAFNQVEQVAGDMPREQPGVKYGPLVFASLSIGRENLKVLAADAQRGGGAVVFRGVKNDDFRAMRAELTGLGEGFVIDPTLFQRFGITEVPTIVLPLEAVVPCEPDGCPSIAFVKVAGNVTVEGALDYIRINSSQTKAKHLANEILTRIRQ